MPKMAYRMFGVVVVLGRVVFDLHLPLLVFALGRVALFRALQQKIASRSKSRCP
jgi:hypothetical protein